MKLPNGAEATVDPAKLRDYCLNQNHPRGRHKARVFLSALGMTDAHTEVLKQALLRAAIEGEAVAGASDQYGERFIIDSVLGWNGRSAQMRSCWIVPTLEPSPRFVTCFVFKEGAK